MRRALAMVAAAALLGLGVCGGAIAQPRASSVPFSAVQASGSEFHINLSRGRVQPGKLRLEFVNYGQDVHDLAIRRIGSTATHNLGRVQPGDRAIGRYTVRSGTYKLWCTISNHRALGMSAVIKVRKSS